MIRLVLVYLGQHCTCSLAPSSQSNLVAVTSGRDAMVKFDGENKISLELSETHCKKNRALNSVTKID